MWPEWPPAACARKDLLEQVDSGERVVKVFCKVFERSESSDRAEFELALAWARAACASSVSIRAWPGWVMK